LSIIDLSEAANQPMHDADELCTIVFNGEIYNFLELRARLEKLGHRFRTQCDTEVILEAYKQYGRDCVTHFNGMFAFALWDRRQRILLLARDRAGEKPLFYAHTAAGFLFASEQRSLRSHPAVKREIDVAGLARYLSFNYVPGTGTLYSAIRKLPAACTMTVGVDGRVVTERYWSLAPHFTRDHGFRNESEAEEALQTLIDDATRLRMISDVPLGAFLSSGVDSATIVAAMKRYSSDVHTFSIGFDESGYDESKDARETALALGVTHADQRVDFETAAMIGAVTHAADEPLADNSALPTWFLSRFTRGHVTVALSGDGGDELFGGYETYLADRVAQPLARLPRGLWRATSRAADRLLPVSFNKIGWEFKTRSFFRGLADAGPYAHYSWRAIFSPEELARLLLPERRAAVLATDPYEDFVAAERATDKAHLLDRAMHVDIGTWLVDDVLVKVDRMSMAHGLEVRAPFLDHRIMEMAAALPASWKVRFGRTKRILRGSQRHRLPPKTLSRKKLGFNAPMSHWLLGPLKAFAQDQLACRAIDNWFDRNEVNRLWTEHETQKSDNGFKLFGLVTLSLWLNANHQ
jgi:asparagine synthase (glutamine-hydrolysing)